MRPEAQHVRFLHPRVQHVAAINDIHLQQLPTVLEMQDQWLIVLLAGLFPSARGFGETEKVSEKVCSLLLTLQYTQCGLRLRLVVHVQRGALLPLT